MNKNSNNIDNQEPFVTEIMKHLNLNCIASHTVCMKIQKLITKNIQSGNIYPQHVLDTYINFLTKSSI